MYISNNVRLLRQWLIWLRGIIRLSHGIIVEQNLKGQLVCGIIRLCHGITVEQHLDGSVGLWDHPVMPRHYLEQHLDVEIDGSVWWGFLLHSELTTRIQKFLQVTISWIC